MYSEHVHAERCQVAQTKIYLPIPNPPPPPPPHPPSLQTKNVTDLKTVYPTNTPLPPQKKNKKKKKHSFWGVSYFLITLVST